MTNNLSLDLTETVKNLDTALNILGMANSQVVQKRKMDLRFKFAWDFGNLAGRSVPFTNFPFGDNLKESAINAGKEKSISRGVTGKKGKFISRSLHQEFQSFLAIRCGSGNHQQQNQNQNQYQYFQHGNNQYSHNQFPQNQNIPSLLSSNFSSSNSFKNKGRGKG